MRRLTVVLAIALLAAASRPAPALAAEAARGQALFEQRCAACHTVGQGDRVGPDLAGVGTRRERAWLARWIAEPDRMLAAHDPVATELLAKYRNVPMPNLGLSTEEVSAVVAYLAGPPATPAASAAASIPAPPGAAAAGKELFTGTRRLLNGGPPCMACHSISGIGALGGGALGPDLTMAASKYGPNGLASVLATIPFPTMSPIFGRRPLAPDEQANLRAFIQSASVAGRAPRTIGRLSVLALVGSVALFALAQLRWRHRLGGVRARMVEPARARMRQHAAGSSRRS